MKIEVMKTPRARVILIVIAVILALSAGFIHFTRLANNYFEGSTQLKQNMDRDVATGIISRPDGTRLLQIESGFFLSRKITPTDLNWLLSELNPPTVASTDPAKRHWLIMKAVVLASTETHLSPGECKITYNAMTPYLSSQTPVDVASAALVLGRLKDKRAVPLLLPLLNQHDRTVNLCASLALKRLGYSVPKH